MTAAEILEAYGVYIAIGFVVAIAIVWLIGRANRKAKVVRESSTRDVLDEGAERASRNQALIDAGTPAPPLDAGPAPASVTAPTPAGADDLTRIKGLGPKIATLLREQGVTRFADIAALNDADIERIDAHLGRFQGRIRRDAWVEQAKLLSAGDEAGFTSKFGQNG
ncbi:MAG: hypothetical protein EBS78_05955 [Altererythrobacter sp.]|jgi:predicted flap endonuclease-1-like 5' DNA nuclease|nr:hypothetical protein [Altererythrobacter sp.]